MFFQLNNSSSIWGEEKDSFYFNPNVKRVNSFISTEGSLRSISSSFDKDVSPLTVKKTEDFRVKYKTEICKFWREKGFCEYGESCAFAHGVKEIRDKNFVPNNYRTKKCRKFYENGYCPYGTRCQFMHLEAGSSNLPRKFNNNFFENSLQKTQDGLSQWIELSRKKFFFFDVADGIDGDSAALPYNQSEIWSNTSERN